MSLPDPTDSLPSFPPAYVSFKLAIAVGIGLLVGLEREWSQKDLGSRTFTIVALLGTLGTLAGQGIAYLAFAGLLVIVLLTGLRSIRESKAVETTTFAAVLLTFVLGALVGLGHHYTPVAAAIIMTLLLSLKPAFTHFAGGLSISEVRSAVLLGLLGLVIYPVLPNSTIDPWNLINPREAWLTVIVIAVLGFVNYVFLRVYRSRGLLYTAVLGGMVNSTATIAEIAGLLKGEANESEVMSVGATTSLLTIVAMFLRNLLILAFFARNAALTAAAPLTMMSAVVFLFLWLGKRAVPEGTPGGAPKLSSPLSLLKILRFGAIFVLIEALGTLGQRHLGQLGFLAVSIVGGLVSSASTAGAAATLASHGSISPQMAGFATVLTSMASALSNLPLVQGQLHCWPLTRRLGIISGIVIAVGLTVMLLLRYI